MTEPEAATTSTDSTGGGPVRWAGVDWSWSEHAVCVIDDTGTSIERFTVKHAAAGLAKLVTVLHRHQVSGVAIERGDGPLVQAPPVDGDPSRTSRCLPSPRSWP